jgi:formate/nitrite transporter FocA (FNT family)
MADPLGAIFHETVAEGHFRLHRTWPSLLATGTVGGIDVSMGVLGLLLVKHQTGSDLLAALAFTIGFIALTLANSELFTENFLVPIAAVAADKGDLKEVWRLWGGTAVTNLIGGYLMVLVIVEGNPEVAPTAIEVGQTFVERGIGWHSFSSAVLAGVVITLMTWMQSATDSMMGKIVAAAMAAFLLAAGHLSHVIVASLEVLAGVLAGADFGYAEWFGMVWMWAVGNAIGGLGLVTVLRLVQVGSERVQREQEREAEDVGPVQERDEGDQHAPAAAPTGSAGDWRPGSRGD